MKDATKWMVRIGFTLALLLSLLPPPVLTQEPAAAESSPAPDENSSKLRARQLPSDIEIRPKSWDVMSNSHSAWEATQDARSKMNRASAALLDQAPENFGESRDVWVWTLGESTTRTKSTEDATANDIRFHGRKATTSEISSVSAIADIDWVDEIRPFLRVMVHNKTQIEDLAALPLVYLIQVPWVEGRADLLRLEDLQDPPAAAAGRIHD